MKKFLSSLLAVSAFTSIAFATSAGAHEPRSLNRDTLHVAVGWRIEPAFVDVVNAFDFIVTDPAPVASIQLNVDLLKFKKDFNPANPELQSTTPLTGALVRDFTNPNRFNIWALPKLPGVYGFHVTGFVNGAGIDETFICGAGTKVPGKSFGCMEEPQVVPGPGWHGR